MHALLRHLEEAGCDSVPRVVGYDGTFEYLEFVPGEAPSKPVAAELAGDEALASVARLLRRVHDAAAGFRPPADARWRSFVGAPETGELVCHNDLYPGNVVFRDGAAAAIIDWDFAAPAPRLFDVASLARFWAPLSTDEQALAWGWPVERRAERLRLVCDAYGLEPGDRARLLEAVKRKNRIDHRTLTTWGPAGVHGFERMWREGGAEKVSANLAWLERHEAELEDALR